MSSSARRFASLEHLELRYCLDAAAASVASFDANAGEGELTLADFSLEDVNPTSPRFGQSVSPSDYLGQVSAWYFGHAT